MGVDRGFRAAYLSAMLIVSHSIAIPEDELHESFVRASGPGGQNVNKVSTAVQLRFDAARSDALPPPVRERLLRLAGHRATADGVIIIDARTHRSQDRNRAEARERLVELVRRALHVPRKRRPTKPTKGSQKRRVESKKKRGAIKQARGRVSPD